MKTKRIASLLLAVVLLCTTVLSVSAKTGTVLDWTQFRGSTLGAGTTDAKLPTSPQQVEEKWSVKLGTGWSASMGTPIIVGEYVYVYGNGKLNRIDRATGEVLKEAPCPGTSQFFSQIAYGDGKIFVPRSVNKTIDGVSRSGAVVYAYDEQSMELLWSTDLLGNPEDLMQPLSAITYYNGYIYMGLSNGKADKGAFVCLSTEDEQPETAEEIKAPVWTYQAEQGKGGYYWSAGAVVGNAILFAGENGVLVSHSLTDSRVFDTVVLEESSEAGVRSTVAYDATTGRAFVSSKSGKLHSVKVSPSGMFDQDSVISKQLDKDITSSPVVFNGRVYQGGGGIQSEAGFAVLDAQTLEVVYTIPQIQTQASPILTTAYASPESGNTVYLYVTKYSGYENGGYAPNSGCTYVIEDGEGQTQPSYEELVTPSQLQYCTQSLTVGEDGSFCYYNDSGKLFYFGYQNPEDGKYTVEDVQRAISRLPSATDITLSGKTMVSRTQERFAMLTEEEQSLVANADHLRAAVEKIAALTDEAEQVKQLTEEIGKLSLDQLTIADYADVTALAARYQALSQAGKEQISNAGILMEAVRIVTDLKDRQDAQKVAEMVTALPETSKLTKDDAEAVNQAYKSYQNLSSSAKEFLSEELISRLEAAYQRVNDLIEEIDAINLAIWNLPADQITRGDQQAVSEIVKRYEALGEANQKYIKGYADVRFAQQVLQGLNENRIIAAVFQRIEGKSKTYTYTGETAGKEYTIQFSGESITNSAIDFAAGISYEPECAADIAKLADGAVAFQTEQQGAFPGTALIALPTDLADGSYPLYRYHSAAKAEKVQVVTVTGGIAQFQLEQGGEYFLAQSLKAQGDGSHVGNGQGAGVQTGDQPASGVLLLLSAAAAAAALRLCRKKEVN